MLKWLKISGDSPFLKSPAKIKYFREFMEKLHTFAILNLDA